MIHHKSYAEVPAETCAAILAEYAEIEGRTIAGASDYGERLRHAVRENGDAFCHLCEEGLLPGQRYAAILIAEGNVAYWLRVCVPCQRVAILRKEGKL